MRIREVSGFTRERISGIIEAAAYWCDAIELNAQGQQSHKNEYGPKKNDVSARVLSIEGQCMYRIRFAYGHYHRNKYATGVL
jgi:hypothetical protein